MYKYKQVIVIRKDLHMRKGKFVSQGAHASCDIMFNALTGGSDVHLNKVMNWFKEGQAKITVYVSSEEELKKVYNTAKEKGILTNLITDFGYTEFKGVETLTACAVGPDLVEVVDQITKDLPLL